jgi:hypothetical protein
MISGLQRLWERARPVTAEPNLQFPRPLLLFQSDDWGRVGVRDGEGLEELRAAGVQLGESAYDFYSLETAGDLQALRELLGKHRDSAGRNPSIGMNFIVANVDFKRALESRDDEVPLMPLTDGLPGRWRRPHLFDGYRQGIQEGVFFPALHGLTHFCAKAVRRELKLDGDRGESMQAMWRAETPYIYWRMPWIGYEYWDRELKPEERFLNFEEQRLAVNRAAEIYRAFFGTAPISACAPGYRSDENTMKAWRECGIRVVQHGPAGHKRPHLDEYGVLHTFRNAEMEPATTKVDLGALIEQVGNCFGRGLPGIVSIHSINFHSTLRDFRTTTLALLDDFLGSVKKRWPNVLYVNDGDLLRIAQEACYLGESRRSRCCK